MKVVSFLGGPNCGKSTTAAHIFASLKREGYNCELVTEYAKDLVWENSLGVLSNQLYVFAKQFHRIWRLKDKVDFIVTDSPIIFSAIYGSVSETFEKLVIEQFTSFDNINIFLNRKIPYNPIGRVHSEDECLEIDEKIKQMFSKHDLKFDLMIDGTAASYEQILKIIKQ
jgi:nicotinamide riboside kinase